jgi:hypothetical protein
MRKPASIKRVMSRQANASNGSNAPQMRSTMQWGDQRVRESGTHTNVMEAAALQVKVAGEVRLHRSSAGLVG